MSFRRLSFRRRCLLKKSIRIQHMVAYPLESGVDGSRSVSSFVYLANTRANNLRTVLTQLVDSKCRNRAPIRLCGADIWHAAARSMVPHEARHFTGDFGTCQTSKKVEYLCTLQTQSGEKPTRSQARRQQSFPNGWTRLQQKNSPASRTGLLKSNCVL